MKRGKTDSLVDVPGVRVGHWDDSVGATGCTVVLCPPGTVGGVDVRGGGPGTRETDLLRPECKVAEVHAILLGGGSAFGLAAADGVVRWLEEQQIGYDVGIAHVPIVPAAILFDLVLGDPGCRPDSAAGHAACQDARPDAVAQGSVGAGMGATVGKGLGVKQACRGGLGSASFESDTGVVVAALAVVNAYGNIVDSAGVTVAGVRRPSEDGRFAGFVDAVELMTPGAALDFAATNTTLAVVATNARLGKSEATKVAQMAHDGLARAIRPVHTSIDGDVVFALASGEVDVSCDLVGALAAEAVAAAIVKAVLSARSGFGVPAARDLVV